MPKTTCDCCGQETDLLEPMPHDGYDGPELVCQWCADEERDALK